MDPQSSLSFHHVKGVAQEFDSCDIGCRGLFPVYPQEQFVLDVRDDIRQRPFGTPLALAKDDQSSQPGELPPELLTEPYVNLSAHPAPIVQPQA